MLFRSGDVLGHHPYVSFRSSVETFLSRAALDPAVLAIKITLYRTSGDTPIGNALIRAAVLGKQVVGLVSAINGRVTSVDVFANGRFFLRTAKRAFVINARGIGARTLTVRASALHMGT